MDEDNDIQKVKPFPVKDKRTEEQKYYDAVDKKRVRELQEALKKNPDGLLSCDFSADTLVGVASIAGYEGPRLTTTKDQKEHTLEMLKSKLKDIEQNIEIAKINEASDWYKYILVIATEHFKRSPVDYESIDPVINYAITATEKMRLDYKEYIKKAVASGTMDIPPNLKARKEEVEQLILALKLELENFVEPKVET